MGRATKFIERARRGTATRVARSVRGLRSSCARAWLWSLLAFVAILPRPAGAFVLHSHAGHGLHVHVVSGLENEQAGLDRDAFHARHHAHAHGEDHHDDDRPHHHGDQEIFLGLPSEPVQLHAVVTPAQPPLERCASFLSTADEIRSQPIDAAVDRARPPIPRGRVLRSGTRTLVRTSSALLL